ncbi:HupE/UreJ family protein [Nocardioides immobilis]|uniref:HupE/UreJ family protein n=1 Tax=Nocardioides immobilis TaxID=2049295 RepID=UPI0015FCCC39|nr:HupE/UreJ family protein [Nocardioides immobilis]
MRTLVRVFALAVLVLALAPSAASAHAMDLSKVRLVLEGGTVHGTTEIAVPALQQVLGSDFTAADHDELASYLREHIAAGTDAGAWPLTIGAMTTREADGMTWVTTAFAFDTGSAGTGDFLFEYDAVIEAVAKHEAEVVVTDGSGDTVVAGVITDMIPAVTIHHEASTGIGAMIGQGFRHVLEGADHLLFLMTLLITAPLIAVGRRWAGRRALRGSLWAVLRVATAFTIGHSLTLIAAAMQWVQLPSRPIEVLIAVSVGIAAVHAIRPLARGGEDLIAAGFGLVHGLAFAGILADLGLDGSASWPALLGFNLGIELAQLTVIALVFPSLYAISTTRWYPTVRSVGAACILVAALGWALDRLGVLVNPLAPLETAAVTHPWALVAALATLAVAAVGRERLAPEAIPAA